MRLSVRVSQSDSSSSAGRRRRAGVLRASGTSGVKGQMTALIPLTALRMSAARNLGVAPATGGPPSDLLIAALLLSLGLSSFHPPFILILILRLALELLLSAKASPFMSKLYPPLFSMARLSLPASLAMLLFPHI